MLYQLSYSHHKGRECSQRNCKTIDFKAPRVKRIELSRGGALRVVPLEIFAVARSVTRGHSQVGYYPT